MTSFRADVVIVGGGFAGITAARENLPHFMKMFEGLRDVSIEALTFPEGAVSPLGEGV